MAYRLYFFKWARTKGSHVVGRDDLLHRLNPLVRRWAKAEWGNSGLISRWSLSAVSSRNRIVLDGTSGAERFALQRTMSSQRRRAGVPTEADVDGALSAAVGADRAGRIVLEAFFALSCILPLEFASLAKCRSMALGV